jgi:hypothetical protein
MRPLGIPWRASAPTNSAQKLEDVEREIANGESQRGLADLQRRFARLPSFFGFGAPRLPFPIRNGMRSATDVRETMNAQV